MKRTPAHVVGARADWLTWTARVVLEENLVKLLKARAAVALREDSPCSIELGTYAFKLLIPGRSGKWVLQNDDVRVVVLEHGAGRQGEADPGWNVTIDCSGTSMLALGYVRAFELFWSIGRELGDVLEARLGRVDLCADVAGFRMKESDRRCFIKQRRVKSRDLFHDGLVDVDDVRRTKTKRGEKKLRTTTGERTVARKVKWHADRRRIVELVDGDAGTEAVMYAGDTFSGFMFGRRTSVSCRIYDKRLQLLDQAEDKRAAEHRNWRAHGWDGEEDVVRVEFEIRGEGIKELKFRCETREGPKEQLARFRQAVDGVWSYCTRKWLRLVRSGEPDVMQPRWRVVQDVTFEAAAEPTKRVRDRGKAKAPQTLGCALSLSASTGTLRPPWSPRIDPETGEVVDELRAKEDPADFVRELVAKTETPEEADAMAKREMDRIVASVAANVVAPIIASELDRAGGSGVRALARVYTKVGAALAKCRDRRREVEAA